MEVKTINVSKLIGSPSALTVEQGDQLYNEIIIWIKTGKKVEIDFSEIESIITPFLNASIGRLYENFTSEQLQERMSIINQPTGTNHKFNMVIRNAKQFYADKSRYINTVNAVLGEGDS